MTTLTNNFTGGKNINLDFLSSINSELFQVPKHYPLISIDDFGTLRHKLNQTKLYAVRSSGIAEDSKENSMAGQFKTHLNVDVQNIPAAIQDIKLHSGKKTGESVPVVIQEMVEDIEISGIAFSHDVDTDKPYTVVQTHKGIGEDLVSGNTSGETWKILNDIHSTDIEANIPESLRTIYRAVQELRSKYPTKYFDIEFAIDIKGQLFVLQIRPLTTVNKETNEILPLSLRYARSVAQKLRNNGGVYGDMIDINPRELVGGEPIIIQTMFQYLFADTAIPETRKEMGYKVSSGKKLAKLVCGNLYISLDEDLRAFLPNNFPDADVEKFIQYYSSLLQRDPDNQSRLDAQLYPITRERAMQVIREIYDEKEEQERVFQFFIGLFENLEQLLSEKFSQYQELEMGLLKDLGVNNYFDLTRATELPCEEIGFLIHLTRRIAKEFAFFARGAFYYSQFQTSHPEIFTTYLYQKDIFLGLISADISEIEFEQIEGFNLLRTFNAHFSRSHAPVYIASDLLNKTENNRVELFLAARENLKFILMRVLYFLGKKLACSGVENIENLDFASLMEDKKKFYTGDSRRKIGSQIIFPGVLTSESTPLAHRVSDKDGYFIGSGILEADSIYIADIARLTERIAEVTGKILIIDHATPEIDGALGYVKGIVTKVGGPLAHIAIRAREMKIPSVVGIGNKFDKIKFGNRVSINFDKQQIYVS